MSESPTPLSLLIGDLLRLQLELLNNPANPAERAARMRGVVALAELAQPLPAKLIDEEQSYLVLASDLHCTSQMECGALWARLVRPQMRHWAFFLHGHYGRDLAGERRPTVIELVRPSKVAQAAAPVLLQSDIRSLPGISHFPAYDRHSDPVEAMNNAPAANEIDEPEDLMRFG
jgi:hypothetical protein